MRVGGREFDMTREQVESRMRGIPAEGIQKYFVEVDGTEYPPKQVLSVVTGWDRQSFTTLEAQRVLNKIGFDCRPAGTAPRSPMRPATQTTGDARDAGLGGRVSALEAALATAQEAIAGLAARLRVLEGS